MAILSTSVLLPDCGARTVLCEGHLIFQVDEVGAARGRIIGMADDAHPLGLALL